MATFCGQFSVLLHSLTVPLDSSHSYSLRCVLRPEPGVSFSLPPTLADRGIVLFQQEHKFPLTWALLQRQVCSLTIDVLEGSRCVGRRCVDLVSVLTYASQTLMLSLPFSDQQTFSLCLVLRFTERLSGGSSGNGMGRGFEDLRIAVGSRENKRRQWRVHMRLTTLQQRQADNSSTCQLQIEGQQDIYRCAIGEDVVLPVETYDSEAALCTVRLGADQDALQALVLLPFALLRSAKPFMLRLPLRDVNGVRGALMGLDWTTVSGSDDRGTNACLLAEIFADEATCWILSAPVFFQLHVDRVDGEVWDGGCVARTGILDEHMHRRPWRLAATFPLSLSPPVEATGLTLTITLHHAHTAQSLASISGVSGLMEDATTFSLFNATLRLRLKCSASESQRFAQSRHPPFGIAAVALRLLQVRHPALKQSLAMAAVYSVDDQQRSFDSVAAWSESDTTTRSSQSSPLQTVVFIASTQRVVGIDLQTDVMRRVQRAELPLRELLAQQRNVVSSLSLPLLSRAECMLDVELCVVPFIKAMVRVQVMEVQRTLVTKDTAMLRMAMGYPILAFNFTALQPGNAMSVDIDTYELLAQEHCRGELLEDVIGDDNEDEQDLLNMRAQQPRKAFLPLQLQLSQGTDQIYSESVRMAPFFLQALRAAASGSTAQVCSEFTLEFVKADLSLKIQVSVTMTAVSACVAQCLTSRPSGSVASNQDGEPTEMDQARMELHLKKAFTKADKDQSNSVSLLELVEVLQRPSGDNDILNLLQTLSASASASVSPGKPPQPTTSFGVATSVIHDKLPANQLLKLLDIDGDGSISWWEWKAVLSQAVRKQSIDPLVVAYFAAMDQQPSRSMGGGMVIADHFQLDMNKTASSKGLMNRFNAHFIASLQSSAQFLQQRLEAAFLAKQGLDLYGQPTNQLDKSSVHDKQQFVAPAKSLTTQNRMPLSKLRQALHHAHYLEQELQHYLDLQHQHLQQIDNFQTQLLSHHATTEVSRHADTQRLQQRLHRQRELQQVLQQYHQQYVEKTRQQQQQQHALSTMQQFLCKQAVPVFRREHERIANVMLHLHFRRWQRHYRHRRVTQSQWRIATFGQRSWRGRQARSTWQRILAAVVLVQRSLRLWRSRCWLRRLRQVRQRGLAQWQRLAANRIMTNWREHSQWRKNTMVMRLQRQWRAYQRRQRRLAQQRAVRDEIVQSICEYLFQRTIDDVEEREVERQRRAWDSLQQQLQQIDAERRTFEQSVWQLQQTQVELQQRHVQEVERSRQETALFAATWIESIQEIVTAVCAETLRHEQELQSMSSSMSTLLWQLTDEAVIQAIAAQEHAAAMRIQQLMKLRHQQKLQEEKATQRREMQQFVNQRAAVGPCPRPDLLETNIGEYWVAEASKICVGEGDEGDLSIAQRRRLARIVAVDTETRVLRTRRLRDGDEEIGPGDSGEPEETEEVAEWESPLIPYDHPHLHWFHCEWRELSRASTALELEKQDIREREEDVHERGQTSNLADDQGGADVRTLCQDADDLVLDPNMECEEQKGDSSRAEQQAEADSELQPVTIIEVPADLVNYVPVDASSEEPMVAGIGKDDPSDGNPHDAPFDVANAVQTGVSNEEPISARVGNDDSPTHEAIGVVKDEPISMISDGPVRMDIISDESHDVSQRPGDHNDKEEDLIEDELIILSDPVSNDDLERDHRTVDAPRPAILESTATAQLRSEVADDQHPHRGGGNEATRSAAHAIDNSQANELSAEDASSSHGLGQESKD